MKEYRITNLIRRFVDDSRWIKVPVDIIPYEKNYGTDISGLFCNINIKQELERLYSNVYFARSRLSKSGSYIGEDLGCGIIYEYLNAIKSLFVQYYKYDGIKETIINKDVLRQIVYSDIERKSNGDLEIGIGNPMILESMLICYYQKKDLYGGFDTCLNVVDKSIESEVYSKELYTQLFIGKADRLFRDIIVLYNEKYYRIFDAEYEFDEENYKLSNIKFIAREENELSSIEPISATRLLEKILYGLKDKKAYKVLLLGDFLYYDERSTIDDLKEMIEYRGKSVKLDNVRKQDEEFKAIFTPVGIKKCLEEYDKIFILDCPEIYYEISLEEKNDQSRILYKMQNDFPELLDLNINTGERDFFNNNGFAAVYYRTQNYLVDMNKSNVKKSRKIKVAFLDFLDDIMKNYSKINDIKELYVYISNNRDFVNEMYDRFNFVRVERYNSKDCRIIKFPYPKAQLEQAVSTKMNIKMTLYKILKMLSPSRKFHWLSTAVSDAKSFVDAYKVSRNILIDIAYSPIKKMGKKEIVYLDVGVDYNIDGIDLKLDKIVKTLIYEMFNFNINRDFMSLENKVLPYCYKKAMANVISGNADNFNDCLFHHFYMKKLMSCYKNYGDSSIEFNIRRYVTKKSCISDVVDFYSPLQYSMKRIIYKMAEQLDAEFCDGKDIIDQLISARHNKEQIDDYVMGLKDACRNFNYTESNLYYRLLNRF